MQIIIHSYKVSTKKIVHITLFNKATPPEVLSSALSYTSETCTDTAGKKIIAITLTKRNLMLEKKYTAEILMYWDPALKVKLLTVSYTFYPHI